MLHAFYGRGDERMRLQTHSTGRHREAVPDENTRQA